MARLYIGAMSETSRLPKPVIDNWQWQFEGACRSLPTEMFFHPDGERGHGVALEKMLQRQSVQLVQY